MNLGVSGQVGWPRQQQEIEFDGHKLVLMPCTKTKSASIHIEISQLSDIKGMTTVNRFLSLLSWCEGQPLEFHYGWSGNPKPVPVEAIRLTTNITYHFAFTRSPLSDPKQRLALALYREAISVNSMPYEFLGYFKILNILFKEGQRQKEWIRSVLPSLSEEDVKKRIAQITSSEPDVAYYLYESGRCAVAHAHSDPLIDPDDVKDLRRLSEDLCVIKRLAEYLIKSELGVSRSHWADAT